MKTFTIRNVDHFYNAKKAHKRPIIVLKCEENIFATRNTNKIIKRSFLEKNILKIDRKISDFLLKYERSNYKVRIPKILKNWSFRYLLYDRVLLLLSNFCNGTNCSICL